MRIDKQRYFGLLDLQLNYLYDDLITNSSDGVCKADFDALRNITSAFDDASANQKIHAVREYYNGAYHPSKANVARLLNDDFADINMHLN